MSSRPAAATAARPLAGGGRRAEAEAKANVEPVGMFPAMLMAAARLTKASASDANSGLAQRSGPGNEDGPASALMQELRGEGEEAKGGVTCSVKIHRNEGLVVKTCDAGSTKIERDLAEKANTTLHSLDSRLAPERLELGGENGEQLLISLFPLGTAFTPKVDDGLVYWSGKDDDPKNGQLLNFTDEALKGLRNLVKALHEAEVAHGDIHAGNIVIVEVNAETKQVELASLIDWSNAVDLSRLKGIPTKTRDIAKGLLKKDEWVTPHVEARLDKTHAPGRELFGTAKLYDDHMMRVMTGGAT